MKKFLVLSSLFILPAGSAFFMLRDSIVYNKYFGVNKISKDETRFNTNYYGLNWGSRTDEVVGIFIYII